MQCLTRGRDQGTIIQPPSVCLSVFSYFPSTVCMYVHASLSTFLSICMRILYLRFTVLVLSIGIDPTYKCDALTQRLHGLLTMLWLYRLKIYTKRWVGLRTVKVGHYSSKRLAPHKIPLLTVRLVLFDSQRSMYMRQPFFGIQVRLKVLGGFHILHYLLFVFEKGANNTSLAPAGFLLLY